MAKLPNRSSSTYLGTHTLTKPNSIARHRRTVNKPENAFTITSPFLRKGESASCKTRSEPPSVASSRQHLVDQRGLSGNTVWKNRDNLSNCSWNLVRHYRHKALHDDCGDFYSRTVRRFLDISKRNDINGVATRKPFRLASITPSFNTLLPPTRDISPSSVRLAVSFKRHGQRVPEYINATKSRPSSRKIDCRTPLGQLDDVYYGCLQYWPRPRVW